MSVLTVQEPAGCLEMGREGEHKTQGPSSPAPLAGGRACGEAGGGCAILLAFPSPVHLLLADLDGT